MELDVQCLVRRAHGVTYIGHVVVENLNHPQVVRIVGSDVHETSMFGEPVRVAAS
ncbi:hypothetical protein C8Q80DRAFT_1166374 [Daedaleopsis nitida]|nr:hypothetical protein C8Q80DRAFT_1166374 [Daedaleopsis nitida]